MTKQLSYTANDTSLSFKMLYLLGIIMIVDGHIGSFDYLNLQGLLRYQNYHIALFMFVSGYYLNLSRSYQDFFKTKALRLLLPLYLWNIFYGVLCWYLNHYQGFSIGEELTLKNIVLAPITDGHQFIYNMASWFIVPLFLVQSLSFMILKPVTSLKNAKLLPLISVLFFILAIVVSCLCIPHAPENHGERNFMLTFYRTIYFLPAFALGYTYRHLIEKHDTISSPMYFLIILSLISLLEVCFPNYNHIPSWLDTINEPMLAIISISLLSIMFWVRIARILSPIMAQSRTLRYCADHTFDIMMHHFIGFMCVKFIFSALSTDTASQLSKTKTDIWYYPFPIPEEIGAWLYITISIVIALLTGFTFRKIYAKLKSKLRLN